MPKYIENKYAEIRWEVDPSDYDSVTDFVVYRFTEKDRQQYRESKRNDILDETCFHKYEKYSMSHGACCSDWIKEGKDYRLFLAIRLILKCKDKKVLKNVLYQLGKIEDMEAIRRLYWDLFPDVLLEHSYKEFLEAFYPGSREVI